ncbi:sensor histidine kinase [Anaerovorax odorimutans]|uniref:sensor histidine kinase n=1 Tax=Anaerovorax odorimutans TaxID=109327 RepID=UPI00040644C7|nr:histidine kinase [Anaerovorax odorimutans]
MKGFFDFEKVSISLIVLLFAVFVFWNVFSSNNENEQAISFNGIIDVSDWDFGQNDPIHLDGQWAFYWKQFIMASELKSYKPDAFVTVPSVWNAYSIGNKKIKGQGYATYVLHVRTGKAQETMLGLNLPTFSSAYKLYINDTLVAANGIIGTSQKEEIGEYKPKVVTFIAPASDFDIVVQVSNFHYARGGFWGSIYLGNPENVLELQNKAFSKEFFIIGALSLIAFFYLSVFILNREMKHSLYFACLCFMLVFTVQSVGQFTLFRYLSAIDFRLVIFIWYTSTIWVLAFLCLYLNELFKSEFSKIITRCYLTFVVFYQLFMLLTPTTYYTRFGRVSDIVEIVGAILLVLIIVDAVRRREKNSWLNMASIIVVLLTYGHDILYLTNVIDDRRGEILYLGIYLYLFFQMILQAEQIRYYYDKKVAAELNFLQSQIKPHFLHNTLNSFMAISRYDIETSRRLMVNFSKYLRQCYAFKENHQLVRFKSEIELVTAYMEIEKIQYEDRLEVEYHIDEADVMVPVMVLQPIIENAVKHGILPKREGGKIEVFIHQEQNELKFLVRDNGIGIEPEKLKQLLKKNVEGGISLSNIHRRLIRLYGKGLNIKSSRGDGTEISWMIPICDRRRKEG